MSKQNTKQTHALYDNFQKIAEFVKNDATKQEAIAILEVITPLNVALNEKLDLPEGAKVEVNWGDEK